MELIIICITVLLVTAMLYSSWLKVWETRKAIEELRYKTFERICTGKSSIGIDANGDIRVV